MVVAPELSRSIAELKGMDDTGALLLGGALVNHVDQTAKRLASSDGAAKAAKAATNEGVLPGL